MHQAPSPAFDIVQNVWEVSKVWLHTLNVQAFYPRLSSDFLDTNCRDLIELFISLGQHSILQLERNRIDIYL